MLIPITGHHKPLLLSLVPLFRSHYHTQPLQHKPLRSQAWHVLIPITYHNLYWTSATLIHHISYKPWHIYCFSNSININLYQQERERIIMDTSGVRKEITPYLQKLLQKCFIHVSSRNINFQTLITHSPSKPYFITLKDEIIGNSNNCIFNKIWQLKTKHSERKG